MRLRERGFSSLGVIGAVTVGSLLTLGYVNLSHYLVAENALEQATRLAVRCVSPTNGDCGNLVQTASRPRWRYRATVASPAGDIYGQEYDYSARMFKRQYSAETTFYSIPQELSPQIEFTSYLVPTVRYREIQALKRADLVFQRQGSRRRIFAEPYAVSFPTFNQSFEEAHDTSSFSAKLRDASVSQRSVLSRFKLVYSGPFNEAVLGTESERVNGDYVRYFSLNGSAVSLSQLLAGEEAVEECEAGKVCSVRSLAGSNLPERTDDYKNVRYLSLYLEIELTNFSANASLGIKGRGTTSGLIIETSGNNHSAKICLGGRDVTKLHVLDGNYFNLWLRGPAGASGGESKWRDDDCEGSYKLSNLLIDVGGSFRPTVNLSIAGQKGDRVQGRARIYAFADTYKAKNVNTPFVVECPPVPIIRNTTIQELTPSAEACGISAEIDSSVELKSVRESAIGCFSDANDQTLLPATLVLPESVNTSFKVTDADVKSREVTHAQCGSDTGPSSSSACGWKMIEGSEKEFELGSVPQEFCPTAKRVRTNLNCFDSEKISSCNVDTLDMTSCASVLEKGEQLADLSSISGLPTGTNNEVSLKLSRGAPVESKQTCEQEFSFNGARECGSIQAAAITSLPQFDRVFAGWRPTEKDAYPNDERVPFCKSLSAGAVQPIAGSSQELVMKGYPFDGIQTLQINESKPSFNGEKIVCQESASIQLSLEERLREYAVLNGYAEAKDSTLKFDFEAKPLGKAKLVSSTLGCVTKKLIDTNGCSKLSYLNVGSEYCGNEIDLGPLEIEPEICRSPGVQCRKELDQVVAIPSLEKSPTESLSLAAQLAQNVLRKFLPQSASECKGSNCIRVKVNLNSDKTVSADAVYEMPLSWPLNDLFGQESLELRKVRTERVEAL